MEGKNVNVASKAQTFPVMASISSLNSDPIFSRFDAEIRPSGASLQLFRKGSDFLVDMKGITGKSYP